MVRSDGDQVPEARAGGGARAPRRSPLTRSRLPRLLLQRLRSSGVDVDEFVARCALPADALREEDVLVSLATLEHAFAAAEELLAEPALGVRMAVDYHRGSFGLLEYTFRFAPTLREAVRRVTRYVGLTNDLVQMSFQETGGAGRVEHWVDGAPMCLGRHPNEYFMVLLTLQVRELTGQHVVPEQVQFAHLAPRDLRPLRDVLGTDEVIFGAQRNALVLGVAALDRPLSAADTALLSILDGVAEEKLAASPPARDFTQQVRRVIREKVDGVLPKMPAVAEAFRMSERTFQRRLGEEGASYQELLDSVRAELARLHVGEGKLSFGEIAYLLGYAELSAFLRAFKRWVGVTPQQHRDQVAEAGSHSERRDRSR